VYNIFFASERKKIIFEQQQKTKDGEDQVSTTNKDKIRRSKQAHVGFTNLAQMIAERWKGIDAEYKKDLHEISRADYVRYENEMNDWNEQRAKDEQRNQHVDSKPGNVLKIDGTKVKLEQLGAKHNVLMDKGTTLSQSNEKLTGLSEYKSDHLEDVADDDAEFGKSILALLMPQEQGRNDDNTDAYANAWDGLFCIEPCTSVYTDVATVKTNCVPSNQSYSNHAIYGDEFSLNPTLATPYSNDAYGSVCSLSPTAASLEYSSSKFMNLDLSNLKSSVTRPYYLEIKRHVTAMNRNDTGFHRNSNSPSFASIVNYQPMIDREFYSTSLPYYSSDTAVATAEYPGTANATMHSLHAASVPMFRRIKSTPSFSPNQESKFLDIFASMQRSFATNAANSQVNATDNFTIQSSEEDFISGGGFNTNANSCAENSSNEYPTLEYLQNFFGIKPPNK
jgi:hypothetical protein